MYYHAHSAGDITRTAYTRAARKVAAEAPHKFLLAFDGSAEARAALEYAGQRAQDTGATLHVLNVQEAFPDDEIIYRTQKMKGERILGTAVAQLDYRGVRYTTEVAFGNVAETIARAAATEGCDLIVIGARDRPAIASFFSRSISRQVVNV